MLVAFVATMSVHEFAAADDAPACQSYGDNIARTHTADADASNRFFTGEYARAFAAQFDALVGGVPGGVKEVASVSAHLHTTDGSQAVDLRFYGKNGCDLGPGATLAMFFYTAIVQQIGTGI